MRFFRFAVSIAWIIMFLHVPLVAFCDNADSWSKAESFFNESKWDQASEEYAKLISGKQAAGEKIYSPVYYNYGTALARAGKYPEAYAQILQSLFLDPIDSDVRNNLRQVRAKLSPNSYATLPPQWKLGLPLDFIAIPSTVWAVLWLTFSALFFWFFPKFKFSGKNTALLSVSGVFAIVWSLSAYSRSGDFACLKAKASIRSGPEASFPEIVALEGGAVFSVKEDRGDWLKVSFTASNTLDNIGWVQKNSVLALRLY